MGDADALKLSSDSPVLLRFDLAALKGRSIEKAVLRLHSFAEYGSVKAGVFRCDQGHERPPSKPIPGIAARFPRDEGIASHPGVLLFSNFEREDWGKEWSFGTGARTLRLVDADAERRFEPLQGKALRVEIPKGANTGLNVGFKFRQKTGEEPEEAYFRYYLRFADDWETVQGGKLPGFSGTYGRAGWGGRKVDGTDGWSARGLFNLVPPPGNPLHGRVPIGNYVYHADMKGRYGEHFVWPLDHLGYLERNRWYSVEQHLKLNTPGEKDGVLRAWVEGRLALEKTDLRFRHADRLRIEQVWMNVYHGGRKPVDRDVHLYIDHVVIAREYIGPAPDLGADRR